MIGVVFFVSSETEIGWSLCDGVDQENEGSCVLLRRLCAPVIANSVSNPVNSDGYPFIKKESTPQITHSTERANIT